MTTDKDQALGLYQKYQVMRTDGTSEVGQKHHQCSYFVLDIQHDPLARYALAAYLEACRLAYPQLSQDLRASLWDNFISTGARFADLFERGLIPEELKGAMVRYIMEGQTLSPEQGGR